MIRNLIICTLFIYLFFGCKTNSTQEIHFAFISDTHIGSRSASQDLQKTIRDINGIPEVDFVVITGDITEMGSDQELLQAKQILDSLQKPWYVIPGNHDTKWSESGNNSFKKIFAGERFAFKEGDYWFVGCNSGPNMRMAPGLVPREDIVWLDSIVAQIGDQPLIFMNHYPLDKGLANWYLVLDKLKEANTQVALCGHGHRNKTYDFAGIPGVMGRSSLTTKKDTAGYNLVTITSDTIHFAERLAGLRTKHAWHKIPLRDYPFQDDTISTSRPKFTVNKAYPQVSEIWSLQDNSDIGAGIVAKDDIAVYTNTNGFIRAIDTESGNLIWEYQTSGKIYSTPAIQDEKVVVASTDGNIYCYNLIDGLENWKYETSKAIVASPVIDSGVVYMGSSEGKFRALALLDGSLMWEYNQLHGFVETQPLVDQDKVYFGDWGGYFYALAKETGELVWQWTNGKSRLYSPAAVFPVKANNKIFIVAPDRHTTAFNAETGKVVWRSNQHIGRESIGISEDREFVYIKDMNDSIHAFRTQPDKMDLAFSIDCGFGYEISPTPIVEYNGLIFVPTQWGTIYVVDRTTQKVVWAHKISNAIINNVCPLEDGTLLTTTMDGKIVRLRYEKNRSI